MLAQAPRRQDDKLRVAVLHTQRAPGLDHLLDEDGDAFRPWRVAAVVASDPASAELERVAATGVPTLVHDLAGFARRRGERPGDLAARRDYDRVTLELLRPHRPDLIVLCGYLHIVTEPLLAAFPRRVINIHDADLALRDADGTPRYRGLHSTRDAIFAGAAETRSSVHLVTAQVDVGPLLLRSWAFPTHPLIRAARAAGRADILKAYAYAQREWMMAAAWGPMLARVIARFAGGRVQVLGGRAVVAGRLGPEELAERAAAPAAPPATRKEMA